MGVGSREALGVRQLAAALFLCANIVPGTISAWRTRQRVCPHICTGEILEPSHSTPNNPLALLSRNVNHYVRPAAVHRMLARED
ncbi:MAG: hypothetical protein GX456_05010 [Verrucomicrobia bacterium]|nr:hypothetical protein [Verrucomicrobiota bacterium]